MNEHNFELDFQKSKKPMFEMKTPKLGSTQGRMKEGMDEQSIESYNLFGHDAEAEVLNQQQLDKIVDMTDNDE